MMPDTFERPLEQVDPNIEENNLNKQIILPLQIPARTKYLYTGAKPLKNGAVY